MNGTPLGPFEFHISRPARDRYQFDDALFSLSGNVIFADFHAARTFAHKMNAKRDLATYPEQAVKAGQINAMGLIDEILHYVAGRYREDADARVIRDALDYLHEQLGRDLVESTLRHFTDEYPPLAVYRHSIGVDEYLAGATDGIEHRAIALEELLMLWLASMNPAFAPYRELFDDTGLKQDGVYLRIIAALHRFFDDKPPFGPDQQNLIDMLRSPALAVPHSLEGQLEYMLARWGSLLGKHLYRLLGNLDVLKEERKLVFLGPGPAPVYEFAGLEQEAERYSRDSDWMPRVVLMAKNAYVWLDQISRRHDRTVTRLDEIPDEELDRLAAWGFTGLWLIGLWERSAASQTIKQLCGNPEAVPSAYSLYDYQIAADLGGNPAYQRLKERAWQRGIRLASDMVPNHVGIYSRWVVEHPDWFVTAEHNPYPWYTYGGPDLSHDERVGLFIEDHYYSKTDAAVVFKRLDRWTGNERYLYHGNDGTSMPWNDTAQLNYLNPEVREAVIQTILHVAREFSIIRFDAAMTLTKKHYQRLWFPEPGSGGAIPTRAEYGLSREEFDALMPNEFWREVVDRVAAEAPGTLLLAEAFWLLEGYFVRTLGMHRVYNSAFMNMLRDEENAKYRLVMKNTLEFDPEILKRFVNFMNNPDERTAVDQFGSDDKYFGVCTLLATMPGLPMFGHGQVEGLAERYGMEYRRAYWDEQPHDWLIARHEREIFPLLHRRALFAEVEHFLLYDCFDASGSVNEDVFAYSNRAGEERALVVYHNRFGTARGWVRTSVAFAAKGAAEGTLVQRTLMDGLGLVADDTLFCIFRDQITGLEYIRNTAEMREQGLYFELGAYKYHVFLGFRTVRDDARRHYAALTDYLNGRGVPSIEEALREVVFQPVQRVFAELVNPGLFGRLLAARGEDAARRPETVELLDEMERHVLALLQEARQLGGGEGDETAIARQARGVVAALLERPASNGRRDGHDGAAAEALRAVQVALGDDDARWATALCWLFVDALGRIAGGEDGAERSRSWVDEWLLGRTVERTLRELGADEQAGARTVLLVKLLTTHARQLAGDGEGQPHRLLEGLFQDEEALEFLRVNRYREVLWYSKEAFEELVQWLLIAATLGAGMDADPDRTATTLVRASALVEQLQQAGEQSSYQVARLLAVGQA